MINLKSQQFILLKRPMGIPTESDFGFKEVKLNSELKENEVRLHGLDYSVDPYMRGRMNDSRSYIEPFQLDQPIDGSVVARVVESENVKLRVGDLVVGKLPWQTEMIVSGDKVHKIETTEDLASRYLGILGMTGLTAYFGLLKIGEPKAGETVLISGAAGAVGTVVGQIARIKGCKVVGIVGSDEKAKVLKDQYGFETLINYKTSKDLARDIREKCPQGVDVFFDNVGGEISDAVIKHINNHGRIVVCGQIALYNAMDVPMGPRIQPLLLTRSMLMRGFIVSQYQEQFPEGIAELSKWLDEGKLKSSETVVAGFEKLPEAFIGLFSGKNIGKMIVKTTE